MATTSKSQYYQSRFQALFQLPEGTFCPEFGDPRLFRLLAAVNQGVYYTWRERDRPASISGRFYHTVSLWWLIALFNGITHPLEIEAGTTVFIPELRNVDAAISNLLVSPVPQVQTQII